jgi:hypothetical protein
MACTRLWTGVESNGRGAHTVAPSVWTGAVAWHVVDFQLAKTTVQGQPGERYALTRDNTHYGPTHAQAIPAEAV